MLLRKYYPVLLVASLLLASCGGANTRYAWNNYDVELYEHYKTPANKEEFIVAMKDIVNSAEEEKKVPPGIYAEYGYLMYEKGDLAQAVLYYQKEAVLWPEAKFLMAKMIENTKKRPGKKDGDTKPPADKVTAVDMSATTPAPVAPSAPSSAPIEQINSNKPTAQFATPKADSKVNQVIDTGRNVTKEESKAVEVLR
jgi:hypothetical protein